jgi:hypothetical protein
LLLPHNPAEAKKEEDESHHNHSRQQPQHQVMSDDNHSSVHRAHRPAASKHAIVNQKQQNIHELKKNPV